jgi:hypothetical protein
MQPGRYPTVAREPVKRSKRRHKSVLNRFAGVVFVPKQSPGDGQQRRSLFPDDRFERHEIPTAKRRDQPWVIVLLPRPAGQ